MGKIISKVFLNEAGETDKILVVKDKTLSATLQHHIFNRGTKQIPNCKYCWDKKTYSVCEGGNIAMGDFVGDKPYLVLMKIVQHPCPRCSAPVISNAEKFLDEYVSTYANPSDVGVSASELEYAIHLLERKAAEGLTDDDINTNDCHIRKN